jgi:hypothetical protein
MTFTADSVRAIASRCGVTSFICNGLKHRRFHATSLRVTGVLSGAESSVVLGFGCDWRVDSISRWCWKPYETTCI